MAGYIFEEFAWERREPDARRERLCRGRPRDHIRLDCRLEGASFLREGAAAKDEVVVMAYNAERGFHLDRQIALLRHDPGMPAPDVILVSEADRGCSRTACRNVARECARRLGMCYLFGVEFLELPRLFEGDGPVLTRCEHGNAILSRYPLGNARLIRFRANQSWHLRGLSPLFGQPRWGGRMALAADVKVGERFLHLYSTHLESGRGNDRYRGEQAAELAEDAAEKPFGAVIGGDMNCGRYLSDLRPGSASEPATRAFFARGFTDAHAGLPASERATTESGVAIDLVLGRGVTFLDAGIGPRAKWGGLSDHLPVWARVRLDGAPAARPQ